MDSRSDRSLFSFLSSILSKNLPRLSKRHFFVLTGTKVLFLLFYYQNLTDLCIDGRFVMCTIVDNQKNRPFPSSPGHLYQNQFKSSAFDMEIIFYSHVQIKLIFTRKVVYLASL